MNFKLFNKWDTTEINVEDPGLKRYISLNPILVPRSFGRNNNQRFGKQ